MKRIAIIPIRSGSRGLKNKNILPLNGKPLVAHSIEAALDSHKFDKVFVSTDSQEYALVSQKYGADVSFLRTKQTATDTASTWDVVREVLGRFEEENEYYDEVMLLQATSPLRSVDDIKSSIDLYYNKKALSVESVTEMEHSPLWSNILPPDGNMDHFFNSEYCSLPRQLLPKYYRENGAIYFFNRDILKKKDNEMFLKGCYAYIMPNIRSIDIDTEMDFFLAEEYLRRLRGRYV